jgi:uncharacterized protein
LKIPGGGWKTIFFCILLVFFSTLPTAALEVPPRPEGRITDRTGTLGRSEIDSLNRKLVAFERETTNQIAVLVIPSLEGESLEDYSIRLAEKWKIGQGGKNNGVILLIVKNEKKLRIEVGYGLEGTLPDALAGSIIRNEIGPRFRDGHFFQGIDAGINAIMAATKGEYRANRKGNQKSQGMPLWVPALFLLAFGLVIVMSAISRKRHYHSGGSRGWTSGGSWGGGGSWGDSGGGFSGGGGDFGGGGASGDW